MNTGSTVAAQAAAPDPPSTELPAASAARPSVPLPVVGAVALAGTLAMTLAFPKLYLAWLAPLGSIALFWAWFRCSPVQALALGWLTGTLYFCIVLSWIAETAGSLVAPFGFMLVLVPAIIEGTAFALAAALSVFAQQRAHRSLAPLAAAAAFALCEWLRSTGPFGVPFGNLSYPQVDGPLAPLAAFIGSFGVTFALAVPAAYLAAMVPPAWSFRALRRGTIALGSVAAIAVLAWLAWPARALPPVTPVTAADAGPASIRARTNPGAGTAAAASSGDPATVTVAIVQPNIRQSLKWEPDALVLAVERTVSMTKQTAASKPLFVLWPETVIPLDLNVAPQVMDTFRELARTQNTTLIVGARQSIGSTGYNALYYFTPDGGLANVYRKRQLVPFVESLPAPWLLGYFPGASLVSRFGEGDTDGILHIGPRIAAPLICWESAFGDLALDAVRSGADVLLIATDDAWFGSTAGPYQHAQIAQMRAIETGAWIVRAAATGISGIIAPNGRYTAMTKLETQDILAGPIGRPVTTFYSHLGSFPIALSLALIYLGAILAPKRRAA